MPALLPKTGAVADPAARQVDPAGCSTAVTVFAGLGAAFTIPVVGEFPAGEFFLAAAAAWALLCAAAHQRWPGRLWRERFFWVLLGGQSIAFLGYVVADFTWHSTWHDIARGWGRMIFLAIDVVAVAYLFSRSARNLPWMLAAQLAGGLVALAVGGAQFGDVWKFGYGLPATYAALAIAAPGGPLAVSAAAATMGVVNFALDFRSVAGLCLVLAAAAALHLFTPALRRAFLPLALAAAAALGVVSYEQTRTGAVIHRATRSDVDRVSMLEAAAEAFAASPVIGHGSWFSRSRVYDDFLQIRDDRAKEAGVGGFAGPNEEPENVALHSQLLVALAEGGLPGGAFFLAYGVGLLWALHELAVVRAWQRDTGVRLFLLLLAAWNLAMSPFSGAHRIYIATAAGLVLLLQAERRTPAEGEARS